MTDTTTTEPRAATGATLRWETDGLTVVLGTGADHPVRVLWLAPSERPVPAPVPQPAQPLVEVLVVGHGHSWHNVRHTASAVGERLRYAAHEETVDGDWQVLTVRQADPLTGLVVRSVLRVARGVAAVQSRTEVENTGDATVVLQAVSSFAAAFGSGLVDLEEVELVTGRSEWLGEGRFTRHPLRTTDGLVELDLATHQAQDARSALAVTSHSTWSSGERMPVGVVEHPASTTAWAWQVEHNGAWRVEHAERLGDGRHGELVLGLHGPTDRHHQWTLPLAPGESFRTVPVAVAVAAGWQDAVGALTAHRRALRREHGHQVDSPLPVIFNDYMNTLMGDPTTAKLLPLVDAAAEAGADYFCVDAGWYDDGGDWFDSVGEWQPSRGRFPGGLAEVVDRIRDAGMVPGLWLEPEVVGVRSTVAETLPAEAFLQRHGTRVVEQGRYFLDLRHPAAVGHLDEVVDRLVRDFGVGYFKLDYNVTPGAGTDLDAPSVGAGLLEHNRAHLAWLEGVLSRHPGLLLENCASGAQRADYAMLSRLHIQSTSDQQTAVLYPPVAAAAPMSVLPEQAGTWGYPQPGMTTEQAAFTLAGGMLGRLYLSGRLDAMSAEELSLVREAVRVHRDLLPLVRTGVPVWPLGLPGWTDEWVATGLRRDDETVLTVWHRGEGTATTDLVLPHLAGARVEVTQVFPDRRPGWELTWVDGGRLRVTAAVGEPSARVIRVRAA